MISTTQKHAKDSGELTDLEMQDNSADLVKENGKEMLAMVKAAMAAGLTEFTTLTLEDNDKTIDWKVRKCMAMRGGKPACFLVAYMELNAHFQVLGPQIPLNDKPSDKPEKSSEAAKT